MFTNTLKDINDRFGHANGNAALKLLAHALRTRSRRPGDLAARLSGDEFILLLSGNRYEESCRVAGELTVMEAGNDMPYQQLTASIGMVSTLPTMEHSSEMMLQRADDALYEAKRNGRAQAVCLEL